MDDSRLLRPEKQRPLFSQVNGFEVEARYGLAALLFATVQLLEQRGIQLRRHLLDGCFEDCRVYCLEVELCGQDAVGNLVVQTVDVQCIVCLQATLPIRIIFSWAVNFLSEDLYLKP